MMDGGTTDRRSEFEVAQRGQLIDCDLSRFYKLYFVGLRTEAHDMTFKILLLINYDLKLVVVNKTPQHIVIM